MVVWLVVWLAKRSYFSAGLASVRLREPQSARVSLWKEAKLIDGESPECLVFGNKSRCEAEVPWALHLHKSTDSFFV